LRVGGSEFVVLKRNFRVGVGFVPLGIGIVMLASNRQVGKTAMSVFDEKYRVVRVERDRLLVRGVHTGDVLTILNSEPEIPLTQEEYPVGKLIALTDPSGAPLN
jgi:hypothetical protein